LTVDRKNVNNLERGFVEHLADPAITLFVRINLGIQ
jgi:hypothetical protein